MTKKSLIIERPIAVSFIVPAIAAVFLWPVVLYQGVPHVGMHFLWLFVAIAPAAIVNGWLPNRVLKVSDLSLMMPLSAASPVVVLITAPLMLGETIRPTGFAGVLVLATGVYALNAADAKVGLLEPLRTLSRQKGVKLMSVLAITAGIFAPLEKGAIRVSTPTFYAALLMTFQALVFLPGALLTRGGQLEDGLPRPFTSWRTLSAGAINAGNTIMHTYSLAALPLAYAIALKRTSSIFGVLAGHYSFREERIKERLLGAMLMLAGTVLILMGYR